ncbi:MAG: hypothetical protein N4A76_09200 [Firmicutes bacterium]|nr:hypothetical protein [Bacillota bacterium]
MDRKKLIVSMLLVIILVVIWRINYNFSTRYQNDLNEVEAFIISGDIENAYSKLNCIDEKYHSSDDKVKDLYSKVSLQNKYNILFNEAKKYVYSGKYSNANKTIDKIGSEYFNYLEVENIRHNINDHYITRLEKLESLKLECDITSFASLYNEVKSYDMEINFRNPELINDLLSKATDYYIDNATKMIKLGYPEDAKEDLKTIENYGFRNDEIERLKEISDTNIKSKRKVNELSKNLSKSSLDYGNITGDIKITVKDAIFEGNLVKLNIYAKNFGATDEYVSINDFTLSNDEGMTVSVNYKTYELDYFDSLKIPYDHYISGWIIFEISPSSNYALNFDNTSSKAKIRLFKK